MKIKQKIRARLNTCGDCINCKLVVWQSNKGIGIETDKYMTAAGRNDGLDSEEDGYFFIVRCAWLKNAVIYPLCLDSCEGKKSYKDD